MRWARYDKWGFTVAWCPNGEKFYWHVYHRVYGVVYGYEMTEVACHRAANWAIGDMRQGLMDA